MVRTFLRVAMSTTAIPSAERSAGGSDDSSTPGGAIGDPDSATYSCVPSPRRAGRAGACRPDGGEQVARSPDRYRDRPGRLVAHVDALRPRRGGRRRARPGRPSRRGDRRDHQGQSDARIEHAGWPWVTDTARRRRACRWSRPGCTGARRACNVCRRVGHVADVRVPHRRAGGRVLGDEVAAVVAAEHAACRRWSAGRRRRRRTSRPPAAGYGAATRPCRSADRSRSGSCRVLPTNTSSLPPRPIEPRGSGSVR